MPTRRASDEINIASLQLASNQNPPTPEAGKVKLFHDADGDLALKDSGGNAVKVGGGGDTTPVYDSGWFAVNNGYVDYTKAHGLGTKPKTVLVLWSNVADNSGVWASVQTYYTTYTLALAGLYWNDTNIVVTTGVNHVIASYWYTSPSGFYRIIARG